MSWNDAPTLSELNILQQGINILQKGQISDPLTLGASLISASWYYLYQWISGLQLPEPNQITNLEEIRQLVLVIRTPFILGVGILITWILDLVYKFTKSYEITKITAILLVFSPNILALGGLIQNTTLGMLGAIMIIDTWDKAKKQPESFTIGFLGIMSTIWLFLVPQLGMLILAITVFWLFEWVFIKQKDPDLVYFRTLGLILLWLISTFIGIQIAYNYLSKTDVYQWHILDVWSGLQKYLITEPIFYFGTWFQQDWGFSLFLSYILKEPASILILILAILLVMLALLGIRKRNINRDWFQNYDFLILLGWLSGLTILSVVFIPGLNTIVDVWYLVIIINIFIAVFLVKVLIPEGFSRLIIWSLLIWYVVGTIWTFPHYLSHTNILTGNGDLKYLMLAGNHIDGGQDLVRLVNWTKRQKIDTIYIDYKGSLDIEDLTTKDLSIYSSEEGENKEKYLAISVNRFHEATLEFEEGRITQDYWWFRWRHPDYQIGNSIIIYKPKY